MKNINLKPRKWRKKMKENTKLKLTYGGRSHVRFSSSEYEQIKKNSKESGKSVPELLRNSYFGKLPIKVLVKENDLDVLRKDLNRIRNNLNQISRIINAGLMKGWNNTLDLVLEQFKILTSQIHYGYGVPKS